MQSKNKTRRVSPGPPTQPPENSVYGINQELENFLNLNASEAFRRPWHRLERGLRLNRIRKFIEAETARMSLSAIDVELLTNLLHRSLDKKLLNSKNCVIYDPEKEEITEIKGLVYHKAADGRILSSLVEKKSGVTFRRKASVATAVPAASATQEPAQN